MKHYLSFLALLSGPVSNCYAGGAGPMWVLPVARLCVAQESHYANSFLGQWILQSRLKLPSEEFEQCARSKHWIPDSVCAELMSLNSEKDLSRSNLERLGSKYIAQLKILDVAAPYVMDSAEADATAKKLPQCPDV
jgi:hypothetical protein